MAVYRWKTITAISCAVMIAAPAMAATPRDMLTAAVFQSHDKRTALTGIIQAENAANSILARSPNDHDANVIRVLSIGYRAKLAHNRADAMTTRKLFEALAVANPRDPEALMAVGTWHLDSINELGVFLAGVALGAHKATGLAAMDRAVALGGDRALFPGLAALFRLAIDPKDEGARKLVELAVGGRTPTGLDQIMQRSAAAILVPLRAGDARAVQAMAKRLLPLGQLKR